MGEGMQRAQAEVKKTQLVEGDIKFLRELLRWTGAATPRELGPQTSQDENRARQKCKRLGLVTYDGGYWRLTDAGRLVIATS